MPDGTLGYRFWGRFTRGDYKAILPRLQRAVESGAEMRFLCQLGIEWEGMTGGAIWEDLKADVKFEVFQGAKWQRIAVVSDLDWIRRLMELLGWVVPGEVKLFTFEQLDEAKAWMAG
jgi:stage II sporulation SpoAA-like protein